ncbi:hypothetical protein FE697_007065 [Mumia zhuanghuii]|uniref:Uncharacterized protein n=2 Tax=Mumia TaxID=1546255 RepID=A0ABW1QMY3_9ACTN|nr:MULTISPECIES: hypothetical protein [Mumia]KAA1423366.1 hypothetical protein FE697_007065 [Mumia zhuanghuii]
MDKRQVKRQVMDVRMLLREWDALDVAGATEHHDEYDCMIGPLLCHLRDGADATFLRGWIARERVDHFGLSPDDSADRALADALVAFGLSAGLTP